MKIRTILSLAIVCSMLGNVPAIAADANTDNDSKTEIITSEREVHDPDSYEPNDTWETAYPYNKVPTTCTAISSRSDLYRLGMKTGGLHSETDVDWYSINLTAGQKYFVDIRNVGLTDCYIELSYFASDGKRYYYTTNPAEKPAFSKKPEKYLYITAPVTTTYYIKIDNGNDWGSSNKTYFFYVGPVKQTFSISNFTIGGAYLFGSTYQTIDLDLTGSVVPKKTEIINLSITDTFPSGGSCSEVDKYMKALFKTYSNISGTGSSVINNIAGVSLGQYWTVGVRCSDNLHTIKWSGKLNGRFKCDMEPYPGNEIE